MNDVRCIELHGEQNNSKDEIIIQLSGSRSSIGKDVMVHNQESVLSLPELKQISSQGNLDSSRINEARQATLLNSQKMRIIEEIMENKRQKYEEIVRQDLQKIKILRISEETERQNMFRNPILKHEKPFVVRNVPEQFSKREFLRSAEKADNKHNSEKKKVNPWLYGRTVLGTFGDFKKNNQSASPVSKKPRMLHEIEIRNQKYNKKIIQTNGDENDKINVIFNQTSNFFKTDYQSQFSPRNITQKDSSPTIVKVISMKQDNQQKNQFFLTESSSFLKQ